MTRVDFYHNAADRLQTTLRIINKAYRQGVSMLVYVPDAKLGQEIDRLLWSHPAGSFLPHCSADSPLTAVTPVVIAGEVAVDTPPLHDELLINLGEEIPPGFSRFERVVEIVTTDDAARAAGRARYRHYRDRGYPITTHDLAAPAS
jgi:DNA polymerase-3 subunit chi